MVKGRLFTKMIPLPRLPVDLKECSSQSGVVADEAGEHLLREIAEGATAPESLRQKDRFDFCDTLESARHRYLARHRRCNPQRVSEGGESSQVP